MTVNVCGNSILFPLGKATDDYAGGLVNHVKKHSRFKLPAYLCEPPNRPYTEP